MHQEFAFYIWGISMLLAVFLFYKYSYICFTQKVKKLEGETSDKVDGQPQMDDENQTFDIKRNLILWLNVYIDIHLFMRRPRWQSGNALASHL